MSIELHLQTFEGPFDLLLHLIDKNQVDIYDIPIAEITRQYLEYLAAMEELDLEIASSFLVMAATLLSIKAKMLLPQDEQAEDAPEEADAREELVLDLLDYLRIQEAAALLSNYAAAEADYYKRPNAENLYLELFSAANPLDGKTLADLTDAFACILKKLEDKPQLFEVAKSRVTVKEKLTELRFLLRKSKNGLLFDDLFINIQSKIEMVVVFLALLELIRSHEARARQESSFGKIYIFTA